ncbi:MAG TPA: histidine phosphatase family protein [Dehalococcoidia bacterium]|nr:histidine phosphatase family protein [Dehalococcoidia bacterium]
MADIIIVRHGNTAWNEIERFRGRAEIELSETGRKQAYATAARLAKLPVSFIYSSPAARAVETANIIAQPHGLSVTSLPAIIDIDFGELQGLSQQEAQLRYTEVYDAWIKSPQAVKFPRGESLAEVRARAGRAVDAIIRGLHDETVILVSHKVVIIALIMHLLKIPDAKFRHISQDTCAVNIFVKQKSFFYATLINDTCHLSEISEAC